MVRVGILGIGQEHPSSSGRGRTLISKLRLLPGAEVAAACDLDETSLERLGREHQIAGFTDMKAFLSSDIDAVVIATPAPLHARHAIAALEAGKHVACEVPAAVTLDECELLVRAAKQNKKSYMMLENYMYQAFVESWRAMIDNGLLGEPIYAEGEYVHDLRWQFYRADGSKAWRADFAPMKYGTHALGPILRLFEDRAVSVTGMGTGSHVHPEATASDMEVGLFRLSQGGVVKILAGFAAAREPKSNYYSLYCTKGFVETHETDSNGNARSCRGYLDGVPHLRGLMSLPLGANHPPEKGRPILWSDSGHASGDYFALKEFVQAITENREPEIDVHRSMDFTAPCICAHLSAERGGQIVEVPDYR